jgi:hypothetical protein
VTLRFETGGLCGTYIFRSDAYAVEDRFVVQADDQLVYDTGCGGGPNNEAIDLCGAGRVTVSVQPSCAGADDTAWEFSWSCPSGAGP